jgi:hypothetical protein
MMCPIRSTDFLRRKGLLGLAIGLLLAGTSQAAFITFSVGGSAATSSIQSTVDSFRTALGDPNNANNAGPLATGRREINWDGGGATTAASSTSPLTAFTNTRGSTMTTAGTGFLQTPLTDPALTGINATYSTTFSTFSPTRIFTPTGSNVTDVTFSVPGTNGATAATVGGFGAVFSDVDLANVTRIEFFNSSNVQIQSLNVLPGTVPSGSLSFLGAVGTAGERIARVRITTGNSALGPNDTNGNPNDVVAMDDFLYSEPQAVPEPASLMLAATGLFAGLLILRRR